MENFLANMPENLLTWLKLIVLTLGVASSTIFGMVKVFGLATVEQHDADIQILSQELTTLHAQNEQIRITVQCLLWEVPAPTCNSNR